MGDGEIINRKAKVWTEVDDERMIGMKCAYAKAVSVEDWRHA